MGEVWVGFDTVLRREVAVKIVDLATAEDPVAASRFRREARATAALSHEHVVTIFDYGTDGANAFLVMELLSGPTVAELIKQRGPLPVELAVDLAAQTAAALSAAHRVGVIHRDIKPSNLILDRPDHLKVVDFGIARLTGATSAQLTAASTVVGSAPYMAPELASGQPATEASDLYSLGCVLMELLTGDPPFAGEHPLAVMQQHISTPDPRASERVPDISPAVDDLVHQLLAKAPEARPADAEQLLARITSIRASLAVPLSVIPPTRVVSQPRSNTPATTRVLAPITERTEPSRTGRRTPRWLNWPVVTAAAAAAVVTLLLIVLPGGSDTNPPDHASPSPPSSTPNTTANPGTQAPQTQILAASVAGLRDAIQQAAAAGDATHPGPDDLLRRVEDIEEQVAAGDTANLDRELEEFSHRLDSLVKGGKLTPAGEDLIRQALTQVQDALS